MNTLKIRAFLSFIVILSAASLAACTAPNLGGEAKYPTGGERSDGGGNDIYSKPESIFGAGGLLGGVNRDAPDNSSGAAGISVNSFLWRASLDTVSFLPIVSADPFGGVILTDWYTPVENAEERFKVNVFILGRQLRSDGIRVRVFKQQLIKGAWQDIEVSADTPRQLEDAILTRARQLRVAQIGITEE
jgi:hypothetical protein